MRLFAYVVAITAVLPLPAFALFEDAPQPMGLTPRGLIALPNALQDPVTFVKPDWFSPPHIGRNPIKDEWIVGEHAVIQTGSDRFLMVALETNFNLLLHPGGGFAEAFAFYEWNGVNLPTNPTLPTSELGYWRGNTPTSHPFVWAPFVYHEGGTYYLFYPATWPGTLTGKLACFVATSTTGDANPSAWTQYDPNPLTTDIEPLFEAPASSRGFRDFQIVPVPKAGGGFTYYNYFIGDQYDPAIGAISGDPQQSVAEVWLRTSDNLLDWSQSIEVGRVFRRINDDWTGAERYHVDYENPFVVRLDENNWYLFVSRHGMFPKQSIRDADPNWQVHPLSTEVYWSPDGLNFSISHQMPNLTTIDGKEMNSVEILRWNDRWFATESQYSNNLDSRPFDACPDGLGNFTCHGPETTRLADILTESAHSLHMVEFEFATPAAARQFWMYE